MNLRVALLTLVLAAGTVFLGSSGVSAAPPPLMIATTSQPMYVTGFDVATAAENGYQIITLAGGTQLSVKRSVLDQLGPARSDAQLRRVAEARYTPKASRKLLGSVTPQDVLQTACGSASFYLYNKTYPKWQVISGAVATTSNIKHVHYWDFELYNPNGDLFLGGGWDNFDVHSRSFIRSDVPPPNLNARGLWHGLLARGEMTLENGAYCSGGHPADQEGF